MNCELGSPNPFPWTRYWRVWDGSSALSESDGRFLQNPRETDEWMTRLGMTNSAQMANQVVTLDQIVADHSVVVLLGRPGAGKSTEIGQAVQNGWFHDGDRPPVVHIGKQYGRSQTARHFLFENSEWKRSDGFPVTLIIDGLDEIIQVNPRFMDEFYGELRDQKAERSHPIRLVLVCRSAEWTGSGVTQLWGKERFIAAELCQLTQQAAVGFVHDRLREQSRENQFWEEASRLKLAPLVVWPHSLDELVNEFEANGQLPSSHFNLLRAAALRRCHPSTTWDQNRAKRTGQNIDPKWMFRLVGRVAALSIFTGRSEVDIEGWEHSEAEPWDETGTRFIKPDDLDELAATGHFDVPKNRHLVFQHQIFREHMAAAWLAERQLTVLQLKQLFGRKIGGAWRHYPQLAAVAAWLASDPSQSEWRKYLIAHEPMILIRADAMNLLDDVKIEIAKALLKRAQQDGWIDPGEAHHELSTLGCEGLAKEVEPYLDDLSAQATAARGLAIKMVTEARLFSLVPKLWQCAKAAHEPMRIPIARALRELAGDGYLEEWEAVLDEQTTSDEHGILLGAALEHLIPKHKGVRDVLQHLLPAKDFHIYGETTFEGVLRRLPAKVTDADILPILKRSEQNHACGFPDQHFGRETILSAAMRLLANHLDKPLYMEAFARWWMARLHSHAYCPLWEKDTKKSPSSGDLLGSNDWVPPTLDDLGFTEPERRRAFVKTFAQVCKSTYFVERDWRYMTSHVRILVRLPDDIFWLIEELDSAATDVALCWAILLSHAYNYQGISESSQRLALEQAFDRVPSLRSLLPNVPSGKSIFQYIEDVRQKHRREDEQNSVEMRNEMARIDAETNARYRRRLEYAEEQTRVGAADAWTALTHALCTGTGGDQMHLHAVDEAKTGPSWMREAATQYLLGIPLAYPGPAVAGEQVSLRCDSVWALYVLWDRLPEEKELHDAVGRHWLPYIFSAMTTYGYTDVNFRVADVIGKFEDEGVRGFIAMLSHDYALQNGMGSVHQLDNAWSDVAANGLVNLLLVRPPEPHGFAETLSCLARHDRPSAETVADHWLDNLTFQLGDQKYATLIAGLITALPGYRWETYGPVLSTSSETARAVLIQTFGRIGINLDRQQRLADFSDEFLANLVELMFATFPPDQDPPSRRRGGVVSSLDEALSARDILFGQVQDRGLIEVVARLRSLNLPGTEQWFAYAASRAHDVRQAAGWIPLSEQDLLGLARQNQLVLVRNGDDFLEAVVLAVRQYGHEVETERLADVWVRTGKREQPEESISDRLDLWLREHLKVLPSREAQTKRGKKTDIDVSITLPGNSTLHTTIEVKKSSRENLLSGIKDQLFVDYLQARGLTHGLYVVFWLKDGETRNHPGISTAAELQRQLDEQATLLSTGGVQIRSLVFDCKIPEDKPTTGTHTIRRMSGKRRVKRSTPIS